jgi:uncharacterized protein
MMSRLWGRLRAAPHELRSGRQNALLGGLERQVHAAVDGTRLCLELVDGEIDSSDARAAMGELETRGDTLRGQFVDQLSGVLITPIDREDLFRVSRSVDDVLDNLRDFVREWDLFGASGRPEYENLLVPMRAALEELRDGVMALAEAPRLASRGSLAAKKNINAVRQGYQHALAGLYEETFSMDTLKHRDLLRRLDVAGLRLGEAADALTDGALKRVT